MATTPPAAPAASAAPRHPLARAVRVALLICVIALGAGITGETLLRLMPADSVTYTHVFYSNGLNAPQGDTTLSTVTSTDANVVNAWSAAFASASITLSEPLTPQCYVLGGAYEDWYTFRWHGVVTHSWQGRCGTFSDHAGGLVDVFTGRYLSSSERAQLPAI